MQKLPQKVVTALVREAGEAEVRSRKGQEPEMERTGLGQCCSMGLPKFVGNRWVLDECSTSARRVLDECSMVLDGARWVLDGARWVLDDARRCSICVRRAVSLPDPDVAKLRHLSCFLIVLYCPAASWENLLLLDGVLLYRSRSCAKHSPLAYIALIISCPLAASRLLGFIRFAGVFAAILT